MYEEMIDFNQAIEEFINKNKNSSVLDQNP